MFLLFGGSLPVFLLLRILLFLARQRIWGVGVRERASPIARHPSPPFIPFSPSLRTPSFYGFHGKRETRRRSFNVRSQGAYVCVHRGEKGELPNCCCHGGRGGRRRTRANVRVVRQMSEKTFSPAQFCFSLSGGESLE